MMFRELGVPSVEELRAMQRLAAQFPNRATHAIDLPYRLARVGPGDPSRVETALWHVEAQLAAWAVWAAGSWELQVATSPGAGTLWPEILAWGLDRARAQRARQAADASWSISARAA